MTLRDTIAMQHGLVLGHASKMWLQSGVRLGETRNLKKFFVICHLSFQAVSNEGSQRLTQERF